MFFLIFLRYRGVFQRLCDTWYSIVFIFDFVCVCENFVFIVDVVKIDSYNLQKLAFLMFGDKKIEIF